MEKNDGHSPKGENLVTVIDYTTPEKQKEMEEIIREREEAEEKLRIEKEAKRKKEAEEEEKNRRDAYRALYRKPKPKALTYTPSRLVDVDTDMTIMNMDEELKLVKETVEHMETQLGEIADFLYRNDKKRLESHKMKKLKWNAKMGRER